MSKFRKRPGMVEAIQYLPPDCEQVWKFLGWPWPQTDELKDCYYDPEWEGEVYIEISEGLTSCLPGDWIVRDATDEKLYLCKPHVFDETYEAVE